MAAAVSMQASAWPSLYWVVGIELVELIEEI